MKQWEREGAAGKKQRLFATRKVVSRGKEEIEYGISIILDHIYFTGASQHNPGISVLQEGKYLKNKGG